MLIRQFYKWDATNNTMLKTCGYRCNDTTMLKMKRNAKDSILMMQCWCNAKNNAKYNAYHNAEHNAKHNAKHNAVA